MLKKLDNKELNTLLEEFLVKVENAFSIESAVLYGSYAKGSANENSDVDVLIVSKDLPEKASKGMNGFRIMSKLDKIYPIIELIAVHPNGLNNEITKSFYEEVFNTGKILR